MDHVNRAVPLRKLRAEASKPPMTANLASEALKARERHKRRTANPGVHLDVEKGEAYGYRLASPHSDTDSWRAMICDALGTRSEATALSFLDHLTGLCRRNWHPDDEEGGGEWVPDEGQLNMILMMVAGIRPKNEMQAALAAQMVAVHLMTMAVSERCLRTYGCADPRLLSAASKLARTFAIQTEALAKLQGRRTSRQKITVSYERHEHQHVHVHRGDQDNGGQPHAKGSDAPLAALLSEDPPTPAVPIAGRQRQARVPDARR
jgi:hypothetical protein